LVGYCLNIVPPEQRLDAGSRNIQIGLPLCFVLTNQGEPLGGIRKSSVSCHCEVADCVNRGGQQDQCSYGTPNNQPSAVLPVLFHRLILPAHEKAPQVSWSPRPCSHSRPITVKLIPSAPPPDPALFLPPKRMKYRLLALVLLVLTSAAARAQTPNEEGLK